MKLFISISNYFCTLVLGIIIGYGWFYYHSTLVDTINKVVSNNTFAQIHQILR